jgi:hypothetical protein
MSTPKAIETLSAPTDDIELHPFERDRSAATVQSQTNSEDTALTRKNLLKVIAASFSFFLAGSNDGSLGALTPYILRTYHVGTEYVALM